MHTYYKKKNSDIKAQQKRQSVLTFSRKRDNAVSQVFDKTDHQVLKLMSEIITILTPCLFDQRLRLSIHGSFPDLLLFPVHSVQSQSHLPLSSPTTSPISLWS